MTNKEKLIEFIKNRTNEETKQILAVLKKKG